MVADGEFHRRLGAARDAEAEKKVVELAVQRLAAEAVNRAEQAESKLTQAMGRIETLETTVGSLKTAKSEAEQDSDEVRRRAEEQEVLFQAEIASVPDQLKAAIEEVVGRVRYENEQTTQTLAAGYNQNLRWILFGSLVAIVTVIFGVSLVLFGSQASSVTYAVTAAWWIITVLTLLAIPFWYRLGAVAAGVSLAIAVLGAIGLTFQLMTAAEGGTIRQSPAPGPRGATPRDSVPAEVPSKSERGGSGRRS
jgi:ABC-type multidrug transport system fused ATPase/permease subunit